MAFEEYSESRIRPRFRIILRKIKNYLSSLSLLYGTIGLFICILLHIASYAQMALPASATAKRILWSRLFGAAKAPISMSGHHRSRVAKRLKNFFQKKN